ncbi:MAG: 16S rRNA (guanine(527)-N(7))-methyltransferase RsmG [Pseudomonadales bacterium]
MDARAPANLAADARLLDVDLSRAQTDLLAEYVALLVQWNKRINLLSRRDIDRIWPRHVLDSLSILPFIAGPRILDLGSGGGLPGIPLAIAAPQLSFTLLDRSERKTRFLEHVALRLGLANVIVRCADIRGRASTDDGATGAGEKAAMSCIVSRAVAEPVRIWQMARGLLAADGVVVVMSAVNVRPVSCSMQASSRQPDSIATIAGVERTLHCIDIPGLDQQHEVLVLRRTDDGRREMRV